MNRITLASLPLFGLLLGAAADPGSPEVVLARMRASQSALKSLSADLEQVKSYPQLGIEDPPERGHLYLTRGRKGTSLRIEIEEPERRVLLVKDGQYALFQPRIRQVIEGSLAGSSGKNPFAGILTGSPEAMKELEQSYSVRAGEPDGLDEPDGRKAHRLEFEALPGAAVYCQQIELFVDAVTYLPLQQSCREANDSVVTFSLSDVETDVALDKNLFELSIPAGVTRLQG